ncbi:unnamed protein product [Paramecium primaurelia]|uniref:SAM-dependent MTase RsmB/NOP-type domain-containing protein n=1 Tax=Paramecium primaurelia TaxID=5886 RepID=A0A8S1PTK2_PARPR|nr:unnamed protein product [Paramecium primaurelia]
MQKYSQIAALLQQCLDRKSTLKSIILKSSSNQSFVRQAYAIISKAIQHYEQLYQIVEEIKSIQYIDIFDYNLLIVLMLDIFNPQNKKAKKMGGVVARYLKTHKVLIKQLLEQNKIYEQEKKYIYIRALQQLPFESEKDEHIPNLCKVDYDIYSQYLSKNPEFLKGNTYIVQSKSSALPAYLLLRNIKNKIADIIDCCAAPGNKTIQLSHYAKQNNITGKIYAIERDEKRFEILKNRLNKYNCENVQPLNFDFLTIKPRDYPNIKIALLDPSCSGSGMLQLRMIEASKDDSIEVPDNKKEQVTQLSQFQSKMLHHLTFFKKLKLIIYSTCSIYKEENEDVANNFLQLHQQWESVNLFPEWPYRGIDNNQHFIRVPPKESDGFFVAMFKRKQ